MKRDYEKNENNEINENFSSISFFRFIRNLSSFHYLVITAHKWQNSHHSLDNQKYIQEAIT